MASDSPIRARYLCGNRDQPPVGSSYRGVGHAWATQLEVRWALTATHGPSDSTSCDIVSAGRASTDLPIFQAGGWKIGRSVDALPAETMSQLVESLGP